MTPLRGLRGGRLRGLRGFIRRAAGKSDVADAAMRGDTAGRPRADRAARRRERPAGRRRDGAALGSVQEATRSSPRR